MFGVAAEAVTGEMRRRAKAFNYGIAYGISDFGLAVQLSIGREEARGFMDTYFSRYPRVAEYMRTVVERARRDGYVTTLLGRRRYLPDILSRNRVIREAAERIAINAPIQGTAADIIKIAMLRIDREVLPEMPGDGDDPPDSRRAALRAPGRSRRARRAARARGHGGRVPLGGPAGRQPRRRTELAGSRGDLRDATDSGRAHGGLASGKSLVAGMLRELGAAVVDADRIAREVLAPGVRRTRMWCASSARIVAGDGTIDRKRLGARIFADPAARQRLNALTHPHIRRRMVEEAAQLAALPETRAIVFDVPLLLDITDGRDLELDGIVVVASLEAARLHRLVARDGFSGEDARRRSPRRCRSRTRSPARTG